MAETATEPGTSVVHDLADKNTTKCGKSAASWSRAVTNLQRMGLVLFCDECKKSS